MAKSEKPNHDAKLRAVSPSLVAIEWVDTDADRTSQRHCPLCFEVEEAGHADDCEYPFIAADLLWLAEENERLKGNLTDDLCCPECGNDIADG